MQFKVFISNSTDPYENLAFEDQLLKYVPTDGCWLFFYKNRPSIVLGRFQNPWIECDLPNIISDQVYLVRRQSGGGTVYHDEGNLNFSFIHGSRDHKKDLNHKILIRALNELGIKAFSTDRSDLKVDFEGIKKFSGSAFKQKRNKSFHHGTLLINTDLVILNKYLKSLHSNAISKGTKSNPSSVVNLNDINPNLNQTLIIDSIVRKFCEEFNIKEIKASEVSDDFNYEKGYLSQLRSKEWLFNETPLFETEFCLGSEQIFVKSKKGRVLEVNYLNPNVAAFDISLIERIIEGKDLSSSGLSQIKEEILSHGIETSDLFNFLKQSGLFI